MGRLVAVLQLQTWLSAEILPLQYEQTSESALRPLGGRTGELSCFVEV